ncbi:MAG: hypothetical protein ACQESZ_10845 [Bacteroidota bacterium]
MKKNDILLISGLIIFFAPFFIFDSVYKTYGQLNDSFPLIMSFVKFAILATLGETIGLRIREGKYTYKGFGILPRALVWGLIGLTIKLAFVIFASGTPVFLEKFAGINNATQFAKMDLGLTKVLVAFCISVAMNVIYAPVMMTMHKITDTHILNTGGTLRGFFRPIALGQISKDINWNVQWNFVFKRTIPLFWFPAHTITFLLDESFQVLFAALLSVSLGIILAIASIKGQKG